MKRITTIIIALICCMGMHAQKVFQLASPDGKIAVTIHPEADGLTYDVSYQQQAIMTGSKAGLNVNGKTLPVRIAGQKKKTGHFSLKPVVAFKFSQIEKDYNELTLNMKDGYSVVWRAYNEGIAYRYETRLKGQMQVDYETVDLNIPDHYLLHIQEDDILTSAYERPYVHVKSGEWTKEKAVACLPVLYQADNCYVLFSEADHADYPRIFMRHAANGMKADYAKYRIKERKQGDRYTAPVEEGNYIALTNGTRKLPWRYMVIGDDAALVTNTMVANLSSPCEIEDTSWIRPGKVSWDWWNGKAVWGPDVDFECGINTDTYKYYIDFAAKNGLESIILDEGWNVDVDHPFDVIPAVDIHELIRYGKSKGVGLILWVTWYAVHTHPEIFKTYSEWGAQGMKIDFMERTDQGISNFYENTVKEAAKYHLLVDFHGAYTPAGLEYRYPNLMAYEGVLGMEQGGRCKPENTIYLPFIRNAVGPMDYTPGAMLSTQPERYGTGSPNAMSVGTRAFQLALFVTSETGTQMLADTPTQYYKNPDCTEFIREVPVIWDETRVLAAKVGEYIVMAKRHGDQWFLAGETNNTPRELTVYLDFLNKPCTMTAFEDGPNAKYQAMDYRRSVKQVDPNTKLTIKMARNGGFAAVVK